MIKVTQAQAVDFADGAVQQELVIIKSDNVVKAVRSRVSLQQSPNQSCSELSSTFGYCRIPS